MDSEKRSQSNEITEVQPVSSSVAQEFSDRASWNGLVWAMTRAYFYEFLYGQVSDNIRGLIEDALKEDPTFRAARDNADEIKPLLKQMNAPEISVLELRDVWSRICQQLSEGK